MLIFDHVSFRYGNGPSAVQNIKLTIPHGENTAVVGANGAGKSTLLRLAAGLLAAEKGRIILDGVPVHADQKEILQKKIGYVGQDNQILSDKTVHSYIADAPRSCGYAENESKVLTAYAIKAMRLEPLADRNWQSLSIGEQRIASIAAMLAKQPSVMFLDDPTAFLDADARHRLTNTLQTLHHTKVIATHDLDLALALCTKVIVLKEGSVYAYGNTQTLLRNVGLLQACNLELPLSAQKYNTYAYR